MWWNTTYITWAVHCIKRTENVIHTLINGSGLWMSVVATKKFNSIPSIFVNSSHTIIEPNQWLFSKRNWPRYRPDASLAAENKWKLLNEHLQIWLAIILMEFISLNRIITHSIEQIKRKDYTNSFGESQCYSKSHSSGIAITEFGITWILWYYVL